MPPSQLTCQYCKEAMVKVGHDSHHGVDLYRCGCCAPIPKEAPVTIEEMYCRWAEKKYGVASVERVEFVADPGWAGTDVTPGDPPSFTVRITASDGAKAEYVDVEMLPSLIREICEFALGEAENG